MTAATSITRAHQILIGRISDALAPLDLNFSRFEAVALLEVSRRGELPMGKMGERLQVHPASITNTIDRLEADGLVERVPHPTDRRTTLARITAKGRVVVQEAARILGEIEFGLQGISVDAQRRLVDDLTPLREDVNDF